MSEAVGQSMRIFKSEVKEIKNEGGRDEVYTPGQYIAYPLSSFTGARDRLLGSPPRPSRTCRRYWTG